MVPVVFFINGFTKGDWLQAFLFAVSVAVGLTPEMLPMIVTANLAKGAIAMAKRKVDREAPQRDSEFRRDGRSLHRQDRHAHAGQDHSRASHRRDRAKRTRKCSISPTSTAIPDGPKNLLDRAVLEHADAGAARMLAVLLHQGRRGPVRLQPPSHVGGRRGFKGTTS